MRTSGIGRVALLAAVAFLALPLAGSLIWMGCGKSPFAVPYSSSPSPTPTGNGTQVWELTIYSGDQTEQVEVTVPPGVYSSVFNQDGNGEWFYLDPQNNRIPVRVEGQIDSADWTFTNMGGSGNGMQMVGNGTGQANAPYPNATSVYGKVTWNFQSPLGSQSDSGTWSGVRTH